VLTIIQYFDGKIDYTSIFNILSVFGQEQRQEIIVIHKTDHKPNMVLNGIQFMELKDNTATNSASLNHIINSRVSNFVLFINGSAYFLPGFYESVLNFIATNKSDIVSIDSTIIDIDLNCDIDNTRTGRLTFDPDFKIIREKDNTTDLTILNPSAFIFDINIFRHVEGFDIPLVLGAETAIALSIDLVRRGSKIHFYDSLPIKTDSKAFSKNDENLKYLRSQYGFDMTVDTLSHPMTDRKRIIGNYMMLDDYYARFFPNFIINRDLKRKFRDKNIVVLYPGVSLEDIAPINIFHYDYVIGIDFTGRIFKCDFVFTQELHILSDLLSTYNKQSLIAPDYIYDKMQNKFVLLRDVTNKVAAIDTTTDKNSIMTTGLYFLDNNPLICLTHMLISAKPKRIQILGADFKWSKGKSHITSSYYNNGYYIAENEYHREDYVNSLNLLGNLGELAESLGVSLMRNHYV
jgi:hypothetical protein